MLFSKRTFYDFCTGFLVFICFTCFSCKKDPTGFDMVYRNQIEIPVGANPLQSHNVVNKSINPDTVRYFSQNQVENSAVLTQITPRSMVMRPLLQSIDFAIFSRVEVFIGADNLPEVNIFYIENVPLNAGGQLNLIPTNVDIKRYLTAPKFNIRTSVRVRDFPPRTLEIEWNASFLAQRS
jgi:hypothetical protein